MSKSACGGRSSKETLRNGSSCDVRETFGMSLWKDIRKGWEGISQKIATHVKNGRQTNFDGIGGWGRSI